MTRQGLNRWLNRVLLEHPVEDRFSAEEFVVELERQGLQVGANCRKLQFGDYCAGVARRQ